VEHFPLVVVGGGSVSRPARERWRLLLCHCLLTPFRQCQTEEVDTLVGDGHRYLQTGSGAILRTQQKLGKP
jgi:hypothetical protein